MDVNSATQGSMNYGIGGNYLGSLQTGLNPAMTSTTTPFPPDSYTPTIFGSQPPAYLTPPPGARYQVPPQASYYQGQGPYDYKTGSAALTTANNYLERQREVAIKEGRPDMWAEINSREKAVNDAQGQLESFKPEDTSS